MTNVTFSNKAKSDLAAISRYTKSKFGLLQAEKYKLGLKKAFIKLAQNPDLGRDAS